MQYEILKQKVYHDGTSMIVVKPGDTHEVSPGLVREWGLLKIINVDKPIASETFEMKPHGIGRYAISGPGMAKPEIIKGKDAAAARLNELNAGIGAGATNGEAPAD